MLVLDGTVLSALYTRSGDNNGNMESVVWKVRTSVVNTFFAILSSPGFHNVLPKAVALEHP